MRPLSLDLRERIVAAYEAGEGSHVTIGERFSVSARVVGKLVAQYRELGTLEPQTHLRGRKPAISEDKRKELKKHVKENPDATGEERRVALGLKCSTKRCIRRCVSWATVTKKDTSSIRTRSLRRKSCTPHLERSSVHSESVTTRFPRRN